jgi:hypothetical protein
MTSQFWEWAAVARLVLALLMFAVFFNLVVRLYQIAAALERLNEALKCAQGLVS